CCFVFFFQAEDGIRDLTVTGVQTCALPIYPRVVTGDEVGPQLRQLRRPEIDAGDRPAPDRHRDGDGLSKARLPPASDAALRFRRSEERRVGKECGARRWAGDEK